MMYHKTQPHYQASNSDLRLQRRVLLIVCLVLLALSVVLGGWALRAKDYPNQVQMQINQRMYSASVSAIDEVNRLGSIVTSNVNARLGRVRQYVYYMEQMNAMSISLAGGEGGRIAPDDAFTALYADLDRFETTLQESTTNTLDVRSMLLTHLQALQAQYLRN